MMESRIGMKVEDDMAAMFHEERERERERERDVYIYIYMHIAREGSELLV